MAMSIKCASAVVAAAGARTITPAKLQLIEDAIKKQMLTLARRDRQRWQSLTRDQRVTEAAAEAMREVQAEAALKQYRASLQVLKTSETDTRITEKAALPGVDLSRSQAYAREMQDTANLQAAIRDRSIADLADLIDAAESTDGVGPLRALGMRLFDLDNPIMTADVVREVFKNASGFTGNVAAKKGAEAWLKTIEGLRQRFNAAGGAIGKLGYGYLSQAHDAARVGSVGKTQWSTTVLPLLDRDQYVRTDGALMSDAEVLKLLEVAHGTIASEGATKTLPGQHQGTGARANAGSDHRVLHFRDGDAWMQYMEGFGQGSLYDSMISHVGKMARDVALLERYGPNPEQQFRLQSDIAERADGAGSAKNRAGLNKPEAYWSLINGSAGAAENRVIGNIFQDLRNVMVASKLGGAVLSSFTDVGTIAATLHYNRLPYFDMLANFGRRLKPGSEERDFLRAHGVISESLASSMNRWTGDNMTNSLSGRVAQSVMHLSLMNAWTDALRGAFAATMMQGFSKKLGKTWAQLDAFDQQLMQRKGITEADWSLITAAAPTMRNGDAYLTGDGIRQANPTPEGNAAAEKWQAFVSDESQFAVVNPDLETRALVTGGGMQRGTFEGEAARSFWQFKSFPTAMMTRHWRRVLETPQGLEGAPTGFGANTQAGGVVNKVAVLAGLNVTLMMLGAVVLQTKAINQGKDPFDMTEGKFWGRALGQGGGMGYVGDMLTKDPTERRSNAAAQAYGSILGPVAGSVAGLAGDVLWTNSWEAAQGKTTHAGAEALGWVNSNLPGANLWQTRAAWEHLFLQNAQEALNPGYQSRLRQRAMKDWGQSYWWGPGDALPERAPDLSAAFGG